MAGRHRARGAETFGVRRWLQLGAASAGVSAALFGVASLGPTAATAQADDTGGSPSTSSESSDTESNSSDTAAPGISTPSPAATTSDDSAAGAETKDVTGDGPRTTVSTQTNTGTSAPADGDAGGVPDEVVEAADAPTPADEGSRSAGRTATPASAAIVADEPLVAPVAPVAQVAQVAPVAPTTTAVAAVDAGVPWAVQSSTRPGPWQGVVNQPITDATAMLRSFITSLPVAQPFRDALLGTLWTVRRSFFNLAPYLDPVQITTNSTGPIQGSVHAVDPEGDAVIYRLTSRPRFGSVTLNADGSYTYTPGAGFDGVDSFVISALDTGLHVNLLDPLRGPTRSGLLVNQGAIEFGFTYTTGAENWTEERRNALEAAALALVPYFLVSAPVTLTYTVTGTYDTNPESGLAGAGSGLMGSEPGFDRLFVQHELLTGVDANGEDADGYIEWNWGHPWALGETVGSEEYDFTATVMHELLHSFGFLSYVNQAGQNLGRDWTIYDSFIVDRHGNRVVSDRYVWNTAFDANLTGADGGLFFNGGNAVAAHGRPVPLYTPSTWEPGSSVTHVDDETFTGGDQKLMNSQTPKGLVTRDLSPLELGILQDIGYRVIHPQPSTYAIAAMVLIFVRRTRKAPLAKMEA